MRHIRLLFIVFGIYLGLFGIYPALAQSGGQFCVRSYEDRNGNGVLDNENETLLTRGISVELLNSNNVVVASALLDRSPDAASGITCFQNLSNGDYSVLISSADYQPTTPTLVTRTISANALPVVVEFGAQRIANTAPTPPPSSGGAVGGVDLGALLLPPENMTPEQLQSYVVRLALSAVGAILVVLVMLFIGFMIYLIRLRDTGPRPVQYSPESVQSTDPAISFPPPPVDELPHSFEDDTDQIRPVQ